MNPNWIERLAGTTRGALLALLRRSRLTINELAAALGITDNAVRMHVAGLQRDGLVEQTGVRRETGGKPAQEFELTVAAEELFPKAYAGVLVELVRVLRDREGDAGVEALMRTVGARLGRSSASSEALPARVEEAASVLRSLGGEVDVSETASGFELRGHGCPLSAMARGDRSACQLAESLVAAVVCAEVHEHCDRTARPRCAFRVVAEA